MTPARVYCLHGFLGLSSDWDFLNPPKPFAVEKVDAFGVLSPRRGASMVDWASSFNHSVSQTPSPRVLLGYSMGGRLALHCLIRNPSLWDAAVIVSANPALPDSERRSRIEADERWARRFEEERWETVVSDWESLPLFGGRPLPFQRRERDFRREDLAGALRAWCTGYQPDLSPRILALPMPLLWITGGRDTRYAARARQLQARQPRSSFEFWTDPQAAHRVPWENPQVFQEHLWRFLERVLLSKSHSKK